MNRNPPGPVDYSLNDNVILSTMWLVNYYIPVWDSISKEKKTSQYFAYIRKLLARNGCWVQELKTSLRKCKSERKFALNRSCNDLERTVFTQGLQINTKKCLHLNDCQNLCLKPPSTTNILRAFLSIHWAFKSVFIKTACLCLFQCSSVWRAKLNNPSKKVAVFEFVWKRQKSQCDVRSVAKLTRTPWSQTRQESCFLSLCSTQRWGVTRSKAIGQSRTTITVETVHAAALG